MREAVLVSSLLAVSTACAVRAPSYRPRVSQALVERTGHGLAPEAGGARIPPGISLADGLSEEEAVAIALWNNAAFQADLARLGFARAELLEAGMLRNPAFSLLFPLGPKQLEATGSLPLEAIWQRPRRIQIARLDLEALSQSLVENGLNLVRDVKVAHTELAAASERARLAAQDVGLRAEIAALAEARLRAGDIGEIEAMAARADREIAREQAARLEREIDLARERLRSMLALPRTEDLTPTPRAAENAAPGEPAKLVETALASRPDLRAAELAMEAARERARLERWRYLPVGPVIDANGEGRRGIEAGPGVEVDIPVLQRNQGGVRKAQAAAERAGLELEAARQRIALEVGVSHGQLRQAAESLESWRARILPSLEESMQAAAKAYAAGEVSYLFVLEASRRLLEARLQTIEAGAALRRARAQLDRSVGTRIAGQP